MAILIEPHRKQNMKIRSTRELISSEQDNEMQIKNGTEWRNDEATLSPYDAKDESQKQTYFSHLM